MPYEPLNNVTTQDRYDDARTLLAPGSVRFDIDVANAAIAYKLGLHWPDVHWGPEIFLGPGFRSFDRLADAISVRSWVAGVPAQVTISAHPASEIPGLLGAPPPTVPNA